MIVANDVSKSPDNKPDIGFNSEYNALHVFWSSNGEHDGEKHFEIARKSKLAKQLISLIADNYKTNKKQNAKNTA
jgi:hypothetical protein